MYVLSLDDKKLYDGYARQVNAYIKETSCTYEEAFNKIYGKVMCGSNLLEKRLDWLYDKQELKG